MRIETEYQLDDGGHHLNIVFPGQQPYFLDYDIAPDNGTCQVHVKGISWAKLGIQSDVTGLLLSLRVVGDELEGEHGPCIFILDPMDLQRQHSPRFINDLVPVVEEVDSDVGRRLVVKAEAINACWLEVFGDEPVIINSEKDPS